MSIDGKKFNLTFLLLSILVILSVAWYSSAQEQTTTQNNIFLDSDQDGLTDDEEKTFGTNPNNPDSDGDGYSDGSEIKSGYDPMKAAPGDKIVTLNSEAENTDSQTESGSNTNITQTLAEKIAVIASDGDSQNDDVSLEEIDTLVDEALNNSSTAPQLTTFTEADLKIKEQDFKGLSEEQIKRKRKDDFSTYITQIAYIFSSNSPEPITSTESFSSIENQITKTIVSAIANQDSSSLENLKESGEKILVQIKEVEVPEDLADTHLKALNFATYSKSLIGYIDPDPNDPIKDIADFSQLEGFLTSIMDFGQEVEAKFSEYGLTYADDALKEKLNDLGIQIDLESLDSNDETDSDETVTNDSE